MRITTNGIDIKVDAGNHTTREGQHKRGKVSKWTKQSINRMIWYISGTRENWVHHITLTYHNSWPTDGKGLKNDLNGFLQYFRREGVSYCWMLEFQKRNAPHYHLLTSAMTEDQFSKAKEVWIRLTNNPGDIPRDREMYGIHKTDIYSDGFIPYIKKDFAKSDQKVIPENMSDIGRLWGHSRHIKVEEIEKDILPEHYEDLYDLWLKRLRSFGITKDLDNFGKNFTLWNIKGEIDLDTIS